jgi:hypothetical protein
MVIKRLYRSPRVRGALRVAAFLTVANLTVTALSLPQARANAEEAVKRSGLALLQQLGPALVGEPEVAVINGQRMSLASKSTPLGVDQVLGRVEQYCHDNSGGLAQELQALPGTAAGLAKLPSGLRDPSAWLTSRQTAGDGKAGQVACVARKDSGGGLSGLMDRILAFTDTGDLSKLGDARYVVARRDEKAGNTLVLAMWTEGSFNIPAMFPETGDTPGSDSRYVPRPPASRRVLTAEISDHPYALRMYDSDQTHADVLKFYEQQMLPRGYQKHELPETDASGELDLNDHVRAFSLNGVAVIVVTSQTPQDKTGVSLIEMGSLGFAQARARVEELMP